IIWRPEPASPVSNAAVGALFTLLCLLPATIRGQNPATGVVTGRVLIRPDSGDVTPAAGAAVTVAGTSLGTVAAADGRYRLNGVPAGASTLHVRLLGYRAVNHAIRI